MNKIETYVALAIEYETTKQEQLLGQMERLWYTLNDYEIEEASNRWCAWLESRPALVRHREATDVLNKLENFRIGAPPEALKARRLYWLRIWQKTLYELTPEEATEEKAKFDFTAELENNSTQITSET